MNEENVSIDIDAEKQLMAPLINFEDTQTTQVGGVFDPSPAENQIMSSTVDSPELIQEIVETNLNEINFENTIIEAPTEETQFENSFVEQSFQETNFETNFVNETTEQPSPELPESTLFENTVIENASVQLPNYSETIKQYTVSADPEMLMKKTERLEEQIVSMGNSINNLENSDRGKWLHPREKDNFEERPSVDPSNLIFDTKTIQMKELPRWV